MRKLKIAWASPLPPQSSGISAYALGLLPRLAEHLDLTVLHDGFMPDGGVERLPLRLLPAREFPEINARQPHDAGIFHMGNSLQHDWILRAMRAFPGLAVLHDSCYHHFLLAQCLKSNDLGVYIREMLVHHGTQGGDAAREMVSAFRENRWTEVAPRMFDFSLLGHVLQHATRAIVHSGYACQMAAAAAPVPVDLIPMYYDPGEGYLPAESADPRRFGAPASVPLVTSFGHLSTHKRVDVILAALGELYRQGVPFYFVIAGTISPDLPYDVERLVEQAGLRGRVSVLGHIDDATMYELIAATDIAINLRYPTAGETSASLLRFLGSGLPTLVTDYGSSAEFPDDVVCKIAHDDREIPQLVERLRRLVERRDERTALGDRARSHVRRHHAVERAAELYLNAIEATVRERALPMIRRATVALRPALEPLSDHPLHAPLLRRITELWSTGSVTQSVAQDRKPWFRPLVSSLIRGWKKRPT